MISTKSLLELDNGLKEVICSDLKITNITDIHELRNHSILFVKDRKYGEKLLNALLNKKDLPSMAPTFIVSSKYCETFQEEIQTKLSSLKAFQLLSTESFELSLCLLSRTFYEEQRKQWNDQIDGRKQGTVDIHPTVQISPNAFVGKDVTIGKGTIIHDGVKVLSQSSIGEDCEIFPNVVIYPNSQIGHRVRIHANSTIGSDGFGYNFINGSHQKIYHFGGVVIGDEVEIGSSSSVDTGTFSPTIIGKGTKLDNLVQIAHNVRLGEGVIICAQSGVAGSTSVGDFTVVGGSTAITDHINVGKGCQIGGKAGVTGDLEDGAIVSGYPARPVKEWLRGVAYIRKMSQRK